MSRKVPCIELTHNWGTESQENFAYCSGNTDPGRGFGHIAIATPDVYKAADYLETQGVKIRRKAGPMMGGPVIAFAEDPGLHCAPNLKLFLTSFFNRWLLG